MERVREKSALVFVLKALIPYSRPNLLLAFRPNQFFNELEKISRHKRATLEQAMRRAQKRGLVEVGPDMIRLTALGQKTVKPYVAKKLKNGHLMIIFDVPEAKSKNRAQLRWLLRKWRFKQIQKSVWLTQYDQVEPVKEAVNELGLRGNVRLYECSLVNILNNQGQK